FRLPWPIEIPRQPVLTALERVCIIDAQGDQRPVSHFCLWCKARHLPAHKLGAAFRQTVERLGPINPGDCRDLIDAAGKTIEYEAAIAPRCPPGEPPCLEEDDALTASLKLKRGGQSGKPAPHHAHIRFDDPIECRQR